MKSYACSSMLADYLSIAMQKRILFYDSVRWKWQDLSLFLISCRKQDTFLQQHSSTLVISGRWDAPSYQLSTPMSKSFQHLSTLLWCRNQSSKMSAHMALKTLGTAIYFEFLVTLHPEVGATHTKRNSSGSESIWQAVTPHLSWPLGY